MDDAERDAAEMAVLQTLLLAIADPSEGRPRPGAHTIALLVSRGWLTLHANDLGHYEPKLTRAGRRELDFFRRRFSGGRGERDPPPPD